MSNQRHSQNPAWDWDISNCALYKHQYQDTLIEQSDQYTLIEQSDQYTLIELSVQYTLIEQSDQDTAVTVFREAV